MGVKCQIIKSNGDIDRVLNPQGQDSELYKSALAETDNPISALNVWATAYTPEFKLYYGDWVVQDEGKEPSLEDVRSYLEARQGIAPPLDDQDIDALRSLMIASNIHTVEELNESLSPFIRRGPIDVNRQTLMSSGLYEVDEINRILQNPELQQSLENLIAKFNSMMLSGPSDRVRYLLTNEYEGDLNFEADTYTASGKRQYINPSRIDSEMIDRVAGIKDRSEFDAAMSSFPYDSVVERYFSDRNYADMIFERYSSFTRLNVVNADGVQMTDSSRENLTSYYNNYNDGIAEGILEDINAMVNMPISLWEDEMLVKEGLRKIALAGAEMNIDLTKLEMAYYNKTKDQFDDFLLGLDVYVRSLKPGRPIDAFFVEDYDNFFGLGNPRTEAVILKPGEENLNLVVLHPYLIETDIDVYNRGSLIHLHDNVYQKVDKRTKEELYDILYQMALVEPAILPSDAYPGNSNKASGHSRESVIQSMKEYISNHIDFNQNEEITLNKVIFGHPLETVRPKLDIQRDLNRYVESKNRDQIVNAFELRPWLLKSQILNPQLYSSALYNIVYDNGYFRLKNSDPMSLRDLELMMPDEFKSQMYDYAIRSSEPTMHDLFFIKDYPDIYKTIDFYQYYYKNNPTAIEDLNLPYTELDGPSGRIKTTSVEDVIRVGNIIYQKVAEDGRYSIYTDVSGVKEQDFGLDSMPGRISPESIVLNQYDKGVEPSESIIYDSYAKEQDINDLKMRKTC